MRRRAFLLALILGACADGADRSRDAAPRYLVTATPIDVGAGPRLCLAIDPNDPAGVWWWQPGRDCSSRSTGPGVFSAEEARISAPGAAGTTAVQFRLQLHVGGPAVVALRLEGTQLHAPSTGSLVATVVRTDLDIPEAR